MGGVAQGRTLKLVKSDNFCLRVSPEDSFYWTLLKIGIHSAKDIKLFGGSVCNKKSIKMKTNFLDFLLFLLILAVKRTP